MEDKFWPHKFANGGHTRDLIAPFSIEHDNDYYRVLGEKYSLLIEFMRKNKAPDEHIRYIKKYSDRVREVVRNYYNGNISTAHEQVKNLLKVISDNSLAVANLYDSYAFLRGKGEIQFFRARLSEGVCDYAAKDMMHIPYKCRVKTGSERFSIPGLPCLYLANTSYCCWLELDRPAEYRFNVSPFLLDGTQKILNLAVSANDVRYLNECEETRVKTWLVLLVLMIATSFRVEENNRSFKSEYIVSQALMLACRQLGIDGVAYYSKKVNDSRLAFPAINLALIAKYERFKEYSPICEHLKADDAYNYLVFKQLSEAKKKSTYKLHVDYEGALPISTGTFSRQLDYKDTEFYLFDKYMFGGWNYSNMEWGQVTNTVQSEQF